LSRDLAFAPAGVRASTRGARPTYYEESLSPQGGRSLVRDSGVLVELTALNDPVAKRPLADPTGLQPDEIHAFLFADSEGVLIHGSPGDSLVEWGLEVMVLKESITLNCPLNLCDAVDVQSLADLLRGHAHCFFRLSRQLPLDIFSTWFKEVTDDGWCGWVTVEWLIRRTRDPLCYPLSVVNKKSAHRLRAFLSGCIPEGQSACGDVIQKCCLRLGETPVAPLSRADGLWLEDTYLREMRLPVEVCVWLVDGASKVATLRASSAWGLGPHSSYQTEAALSHFRHMAWSCGHFFPLHTFATPSFAFLTQEVAWRILDDRSMHKLTGPFADVCSNMASLRMPLPLLQCSPLGCLLASVPRRISPTCCHLFILVRSLRWWPLPLDLFLPQQLGDTRQRWN